MATVETAESVAQYLKSLCWPVAVVLRAGGLTDIERLLQKGTVVGEYSTIHLLLTCGMHDSKMDSLISGGLQFLPFFSDSFLTSFIHNYTDSSHTIS